MRQILAIARKELLLWAQKPGSWFIVFIVPFLFIWIIQAVFGGSGVPTVTVFVVNQDASPQAELVMAALRESKNLVVEELDTREEADRRVGAGERMAALVIPPGFSLGLSTSEGAEIEIIVDPARAEQANIVIGLVNAALGPFMVDAEVSRGVATGVSQAMDALRRGSAGAEGSPETLENPGSQDFDLSALEEFFTAAIKAVVSNEVQSAINDPLVRLKVEAYTAGDSAKTVRPPSLVDYLVPGYSLMFVFFLIPSLATGVVEERQTGTLRRLLAAPLPRSRILVGKMLPYFLIAVVQFVFVLGVSSLLFGVDLGGSPLGLAFIILPSALAMAALGVLIASFAHSQGQADGLAIVLVLAMAVVSGAMFPAIQIPGLQNITPHYWAMQGFLNVIARGQGVEGALLPAGVLLTMAAVFFTAGAVRFSFE